MRSGLKAAPLRPADKVVARRTSDAEREHAATKLQGMKKMMNAKIEAQELRAAKRRQLGVTHANQGFLERTKAWDSIGTRVRQRRVVNGGERVCALDTG